VGLSHLGLGHVTLAEIIPTQTAQDLSSRFDPSSKASANIITGFVSNGKCNSNVKCIPLFFLGSTNGSNAYFIVFFIFFFTFILYSGFFKWKNIITLKNGKPSAPVVKIGETQKRGKTMVSSVASKNRESNSKKEESQTLWLLYLRSEGGSHGCRA
jgi:hypothetical protein